MTREAEILREHGMRITHPRLIVLRFLLDNRTHPSAEEIYRGLKDDNPALSLTTVYNILSAFKENGMVMELTITPGERRYDIDTSIHHHFLCRKCGTIYDIDISCPYLREVLDGEHIVEEVHGYFTGVCSNCRSAMEGKTKGKLIKNM